jgi:type II secretion system protein N
MKLLKWAGYAGLFLLSLALGLYMTFPWNALKDRLLSAASAESGWRITAERMRPNWFTGVSLYGFSAAPPTPADAPPLELDRIDARAHVLGFLTGSRGVTLRVPVGQGQIWAQLSAREGQQQLKSTIEDVELGLISGLVTLTGLPLSGGVDGKVNLTISSENPADSTGSVELTGTDLELGAGGKIGNYPIPSMRIGSLEWSIPVQSGKAQISNQQIRGGDVDLDVDGSVSFTLPVERSTMDLSVSFEPSPEFLQKEPLLKALLNNIRRARGPDGFYTYGVVGSFRNAKTFPRPRR